MASYEEKCRGLTLMSEKLRPLMRNNYCGEIRIKMIHGEIDDLRYAVTHQIKPKRKNRILSEYKNQ